VDVEIDEEPWCRVPGVPVPRLAGGWSLRPVRPHAGDVALVHRWMNLPHVAAGWQQDWSLARWHAELAAQLAGDHSLPCMVSLDGRDVGYVEIYRVIRDRLARCYPHHPHDLGVHVAIGEPDAVGRGLGSSLLRAVSDGLLAADPHCLRVVAEPDVHNGASIGAFRNAGFVQEREIGLPGKTAALMIRPGTTSRRSGLYRA
jgi:RimJ/RimL family protein N-acetyltransferase